MTALEAQAQAARKAREFRRHMTLATLHLGHCDRIEAEVTELLPLCTPDAAEAIRGALDGTPAALVAESEAAR